MNNYFFVLFFLGFSSLGFCGVQPPPSSGTTSNVPSALVDKFLALASSISGPPPSNNRKEQAQLEAMVSAGLASLTGVFDSLPKPDPKNPLPPEKALEQFFESTGVELSSAAIAAFDKAMKNAKPPEAHRESGGNVDLDLD